MTLGILVLRSGGLTEESSRNKQEELNCRESTASLSRRFCIFYEKERGHGGRNEGVKFSF